MRGSECHKGSCTLPEIIFSSDCIRHFELENLLCFTLFPIITGSINANTGHNMTRPLPFSPHPPQNHCPQPEPTEYKQTSVTAEAAAVRDPSAMGAARCPGTLPKMPTLHLSCSGLRSSAAVLGKVPSPTGAPAPYSPTESLHPHTASRVARLVEVGMARRQHPPR